MAITSTGTPPQLDAKQKGALANLVKQHGGDPSQLKAGSDPKALFQKLGITKQEVDSAIGLGNSVAGNTTQGTTTTAS